MTADDIAARADTDMNSWRVQHGLRKSLARSHSVLSKYLKLGCQWIKLSDFVTRLKVYQYPCMPGDWTTAAEAREIRREQLSW